MTASPAPQSPPQTALRPPDQVMRLARMGSFFATRLSFMRALIRDLHREGATIERPVWDIDAGGYGRAVYTLRLGGRPYSLVAISTPLSDDDRTDRVIAEAWDTAYCLFDGVPETVDLDRLQRNLPKQEAARFSERELVLSRANKSVRFFEHCVAALAAGRQPDADLLRRTGYLMRTTAVYGNGKFGIADRAVIADRPFLDSAFRAEMLTVWLIREFTLHLADHIAAARNPDAARLSPAARRALGIGNATGLGMAPFLVSHPTLLNNWMLARETALARVRAVERPEPETAERFVALLDRAARHLTDWRVEDTRQSARVAALEDELRNVATHYTDMVMGADFPWDTIVRHSEAMSLEMQELTVALVLEPNGALIDGLTDCMTAGPEPRLTPDWPLSRIADALAQHYAWTDRIDFDDPSDRQRFWYVSEEKAEPRIGDRYGEAGAEKELPLDIAWQVRGLKAALAEAERDETAGSLALRRPDLRGILRRVQIAVRHPYSEIRDNLTAADCLPIDMLRCKLSFFGAAKFDPKSDLWTRINMYQGAPGRYEIDRADADDWAFPCLPETY